MRYQQTICDGLSEVPRGLNTTRLAFLVRVLVDMAAIVAIVEERVNGADLVQNRLSHYLFTTFFTAHKQQRGSTISFKVSDKGVVFDFRSAQSLSCPAPLLRTAHH
jgi:hypothetical protein